MGGSALNRHTPLTIPTDPSANRLFNQLLVTTHRKQVFSPIPLGLMEEVFVPPGKWPRLPFMSIVRPSANSRTHWYIYCQNVRGLRTKASELLADVYSSNFHVICLNEIWLNDSCFNCSFFPDTYWFVDPVGWVLRRLFLMTLIYLSATAILHLTQLRTHLCGILAALSTYLTPRTFVSFRETSLYLCSTGNLVYLPLFLTATTNWRTKPYFLHVFTRLVSA